MKVFATPQECGDEASRLKKLEPHIRLVPYELEAGGWVLGRLVKLRRKENREEIFHIPDGFI